MVIGRGKADEGYLSVSLYVRYFVLGGEDEIAGRIRHIRRPQYLLSKFYTAEIDEAPRQVKVCVK